MRVLAILARIMLDKAEKGKDFREDRMYIDGSYNSEGIAAMLAAQAISGHSRAEGSASSSGGAGDTVDISDEARRLFSETIHRYDQAAPGQGSAGSDAGGQQGGGAGGGAQGLDESSGSGESVEDIKKKIESLKSQLMSLSAQAGAGGGDAAATSKMQALEAQISALEAQLNSMQG